jgi:L-ascorbate metabolism protein UlaG (beta-lactamase superfamily)
VKLEKRVHFLGHATAVIEMGGLRVLTDPVLRSHLAFLERQVEPIAPEDYAGIDVVLISHLHWDHLDMPSLRRVGTEAVIVVPRGAGPLLRRNGFSTVVELLPGEQATFGDLVVTATTAIHRGFRPPFGPDAPSLGFVLDDGDLRIYFAGDTDIFPEMADLGSLDLALLPIWGWGPRLGPGHLDPYRAAEALRLLEPRVAVPIHWGTYWLRGGARLLRDRLVHPPREFAAYAAVSAPEVVIAAALPGERLERIR